MAQLNEEIILSTDLPFLDSYAGQSTNELIDLQGSYRIDSIVLAFEEALQRKEELTQQEKVVLSVEALEREVNNGGFGQFFCNSSRDFVPNIGDALDEIGCPKTGVLVQTAMTILCIDTSMTSDEIENVACDVSELQYERLGELDDIYYKGEEEPIADKLFEFIKRNRSLISIGAPK